MASDNDDHDDEGDDDDLFPVMAPIVVRPGKGKGVTAKEKENFQQSLVPLPGCDALPISCDGSVVAADIPAPATDGQDVILKRYETTCRKLKTTRGHKKSTTKMVVHIAGVVVGGGVPARGHGCDCAYFGRGIDGR